LIRRTKVLVAVFSIIAVVAVGALIILALYPLSHLGAILGGMLVILVGIASIFLLLYSRSESN
jgi:hypothetical protein